MMMVKLESMEVLNNLLIEYSLCIHLTGLSMLGHRLQDEGRHRRVDHLEGGFNFSLDQDVALLTV